MIIQVLFFVVVVPFLPLLISRQRDWGEAGAYALISTLGFVISRVLAARRHPDLITERSRFLAPADTALWDKLLAPLVGLGGGLEARIAWSPTFGLPAKVAALVIHPGRVRPGILCLAGEPLLRGHGAHPDRTRPPRRAERPLPLGAASRLRHLASPVFLDTLWAFLPALFLTIVLIIRTRLEDQTLQDQLAGYREYAGRVHDRLLPGVW